MAPPRYACRACGVWTCSACGWTRSQASLNYREHHCAKCPSREGTLLPTMHTEKMWRRHDYYDSPLPDPYPFGQRPPVDPASPFGHRVASTGPEFYQGIRVPPTGPYAPLDVPSWKRGVDDALRHIRREETT